MSMNIRRIVKDDCVALLHLIQELAEYEREPEAVTVTLDHFIESGFGNSPVWYGFVAEDNDDIIGFVLYYIRYSTWKGQRMYLEDFLVTEKARGRGVGKLLFDQLILEARDKNFNGIVWQVLKWNEPAIQFYKKYNARFDDEWLTCSIEI
ncbi:MAG: GNAT family N-acetyltransferase [Bacteroidetes bacterium]|nr:GNAT family N-acetyltransferase [Bacteroidota bacterium]